MKRTMKSKKTRHLLMPVLLIAMTLIACGTSTRMPQAENPSAAAAVSADEEKNENISSSLKDGSYLPAVFLATGGTGRVVFTCPEVLITDGAAEAVIELDSPHYEWLKVDGVQYDADNAGEIGRTRSVFRIPAALDQEMTITGLTTAMSEPHEIEYTLFISLTQPEDEKETDSDEDPAAPGTDTMEGKESLSAPPAINGLTFLSVMPLAYAKTFDIYTYRLTGGRAEDIYRLIDIHGSGRYLLIPESGEGNSAEGQKAVLEGLADDIIPLKAPLDTLYVAATSSMALFDAAGALDLVKLTGTKAEGWYIDAPKAALAEGRMAYAGKYSAPDYERLAAAGCDLAVESMMILHAPLVREKLEALGIPVLVDTSSNESHPLGRTEWVRLYGVLTGHEQAAEAFFAKQKEEFAKADSYVNTGKTVAFFSISSGGWVNVRAADDYIPYMIHLAGGEYIFKELLSESTSLASVRLSMEDFYKTARDADFLIYNATIEGPVKSIDALCEKAALLREFKAVQAGNVWQVERSLYQSPDIAARMVTDLHGMLTGGNAADLTFLERLA